MRTGAALQTDDVSPAISRPLWKRRWFQNSALALIAILGAYGLIYHDVVARAHEAYEQGELHMAWYRDPQAKQKYFDDKMAAERAALEARFAAKKISEADYRRRLDSLEFDHDFALSESSVKYAYQWYKDAYEMFSPPQSKWTRLAREKAPQALELWKQELRAQNVPFENTMFD